MSDLVPLLQSSYLYEVELAKSKLASRDIPSYVRNEFVNNVAVFPISQNYVLVVNERHYDDALQIIQEIEELDEDDNFN